MYTAFPVRHFPFLSIFWVILILCKVVLVVDIFDDEVCVHSSLFLLPDDLVATSFENGFILFSLIKRLSENLSSLFDNGR